MAKHKSSNVVPFILLLLFVAVLAAVGFVAYSIAQNVSKNTREKMERKHVVFTKDGMKVEVKELQDEAYKDRTQRCVSLRCCIGVNANCGLAGSVLVNVWNHTSFPNYKSRLWNMTGSSSSQQQQQHGVEKRKPYVESALLLQRSNLTSP